MASSNDSEAIIVTPSRQKFTIALQEYNDGWLAANSGLGAITCLSSRVKLFYPPTPAHLCLLLSMFQISTESGDENGSWHSKTTLPILPSLFVLHEPSLYFLSRDDLQPNASHWTVSSYMALIAHSLTSLTFLSRSSPTDSGVAFALFDSQLDQLTLPVSKPLTVYHHFDHDTDQPRPRMESVTPFVEVYFEWTAVFNQEEDESTDDSKSRTSHKMKLHRVDRHAMG